MPRIIAIGTRSHCNAAEVARSSASGMLAENGSQKDHAVRKTWVVVADRSRARIFSVDSPRGPLHELESLVHPEARAHERDLTSDRPGRASDQHVLNAAHTARDQQAAEFAREIVERLEGGRVKGGFEQLVLVAAPDLLGMVRKAMNGKLSKLVSRTVDKNLTQHDPREIRKSLPEFL